jgi:hypothetical protein
MKPRNLYQIIIGTLMVISGIVSLFLISGDAKIGIVLLIGGVVFLINGIVYHRKYGEDPESDERSKKIVAYGLSYAWSTGVFFMWGLFWLDYLGVLKLSEQNALMASILFLALSSAIFHIYLLRKGDVG